MIYYHTNNKIFFFSVALLCLIHLKYYLLIYAYLTEEVRDRILRSMLWKRRPVSKMYQLKALAPAACINLLYSSTLQHCTTSLLHDSLSVATTLRPRRSAASPIGSSVHLHGTLHLTWPWSYNLGIWLLWRNSCKTFWIVALGLKYYEFLTQCIIEEIHLE